MSSTSTSKYIFVMENLNCANCANLIEEKINNHENILKANFSFASKKMVIFPTEEYVNKFNDDKIIIKDLQITIQKISDSIEDGVVVNIINDNNHNHAHDHEQHFHYDGTNPIGKLRHFIFGEKTLFYNVAEVVLGLMLLLVVEFSSLIHEPYDLYTIVAAYLVIARYVLIIGFKNIAKGRFMDENFLMIIATFGAFILGDYAEAFGVMLFYRIGIIFEDRATMRSRQEIMSVIDMRPEVVTLVEGSTKTEIPAELAKVGQIVQVRVGERIPLDGVVVNGESQIDTSPVTGESKPLLSTVGNSVISGCINLTGTLQIKIEKTLQESFVTKMLEAVEMATANKPTVDRFITRFARFYTPIVLAITALTIIIPSLITGEWNKWIYTGLTFLVISCPCALVLSVPLAFFAGIGGGSKHGILFKGGLSMENMNSVKVIAMDKTGTLTQGTFAVSEIKSLADNISNEKLLQICASAEAHSTHPIATSLIEKARELKLKLYEPTNVSEYAGKGLEAVVDSQKIYCGNKKFISEIIDNSLPEINDDASTIVYVATKEDLWGYILIKDTLKHDASQAIANLQNKNYKIAMITGDNKKVADKVANDLHIDEVYSEVLPTDKLNIVQKLRHKYGAIMFVGDGINDAPVLAGANVGCAMGTGADAALEAADVVYMNSDVTSINKSLKIAKDTMQIAWQNVFFAIGIKLIVMLLGFIGYASLWFAIFADTGVMIICVLNAIRLLYPKLA